VPGLGKIPASMVDSSNPCVFVPAEALGCTGGEMPGDLEQNADLLDRLERIRCAASVAMGIAPNLEKAAAIPSIPKVAMVAPPAKAGTLSGRVLAPEEMDIQVRMISVGQPHRAVPLTGALCLAVGVRIPGSIPQAMAGGGVPADRSIRIAQPSGFTVVDAKLAAGSNEIRAEYAAVYRTARRLFEGYVRCRPPSAG
ncbi:MAG: PrpF family protein, partial [Hyphomicrobiaceae bacterium]|nr:PrpF family protein [Hyphomicrobiaceae bacterium]